MTKAEDADKSLSQWITAHLAEIRVALTTIATVLTAFAVCAAIAGAWPASSAAMGLAFMCVRAECWTLERALVVVQLALEDRTP